MINLGNFMKIHDYNCTITDTNNNINIIINIIKWNKNIINIIVLNILLKDFQTSKISIH